MFLINVAVNSIAKRKAKPNGSSCKEAGEGGGGYSKHKYEILYIADAKNSEIPRRNLPPPQAYRTS